MNLLVEKGVISEVECGSNFAYIMNDNSDFLSTEYKVLQSQSGNHFIKCMKMLCNGKIELYYCVSDFKPLSSILHSIDPDGFVTIVGNLFSGIVDVKNNGFLSCKNIDSSFEHIYVDLNTYKVSLVYIPINKHEYSDDAAFENAIRTNLVKIISAIPSLSSTKTMQLANALQNGIMSVEDLVSGTGIRTSKVNKSEEVNAYRPLGMKLVAISAPTRVELSIDKDEFTIGKKETNDGIVSFNKMISRVHCKITNRNGQYAVSDLQSANGTYVNGLRLKPNQIHPIKNGDIIRLANSDFQVVIQ